MLVYLDTVAGLVKAKAIGHVFGHNRIVVRVTDNNSFLKKGAIMHYSSFRVVPRDKVIRTRFSQVILPFTWANNKPSKVYTLNYGDLLEAVQ